MKKNIDIHIINTLLFLLPLVYMSGYFSYSSLRYFVFGSVVLFLSIFNAVKFLKNKWIVKSFFKSWYSYGLIVYLLSFLLVSITSFDKALSFFSSFSRTDGFFAILFLSLFSLSIYGIISTTNDRKVVFGFIRSSVLGAVILSLFIWFSPEGLNIFKWKWLLESGGGAMTGNQSVAGSYIIWNIFFSIILFIKSESFKKKIFSAAYLLILIFSPLFFNWHILLKSEQYTGIISLIGLARGAFLGVIFGFIVALGVWLVLQEQKIKKYVGAGILIIIFISTIFSGISLLQKSSFLHQKFIENTSEARFVFWDSALKGFKEHPLLGWGPNTFSYPFHKFFNPVLFIKNDNSNVVVDIMVDKSHNIFFETLVSGGILLTSALLFFIFSIIAGLLKSKKRGELSSLEVSLLIGALLGWLLQAQFVFDSLLSLAMLYLVCGISYSILVQEKDKDIKQKRHQLSLKEKWIFFVIFCIMFILFIFTIVLPYKKNRAMYNTYNTSLPLRVSLWKNLSGISPMGDSGDSILMFNKIFNSYYKEIPNLKTLDVRTKEVFLQEIDEINKYIGFLDQNEGNYELTLLRIKFSYLRMRMANDFSDPLLSETQNLFEKAILLSPKDPRTYWTNAQIQIAINNLPKAKKLLEQIVAIEPRISLTHRMILLLAKNMKDVEYYNFALKRAKENIPDFLMVNP